jgi:hypothetical protein
MLDAINEWAFEAFDDPILDESASGFSVRSDLIPRSL